MNSIFSLCSSWAIAAKITKILPDVKKEVVDQVEKLYLEMVLKKTHGRVGQTAQLAGLHHSGLYDKMKRLGLHKKDFKNKPEQLIFHFSLSNAVSIITPVLEGVCLTGFSEQGIAIEFATKSRQQSLPGSYLA